MALPFDAVVIALSVTRWLKLHHLEPIFSDLLHVASVFHGKFLFDLIALFHKQLEELHRLLLHVLLIFVDEDWLHDELVKTV